MGLLIIQVQFIVKLLGRANFRSGEANRKGNNDIAVSYKRKITRPGNFLRDRRFATELALIQFHINIKLLYRSNSCPIEVVREEKRNN